MNKEHRRTAYAPENTSRPAWRQLLKTTEGRILLLGIIVALLGLITMGVVAIWSPQAARMIGAMSFFNVVFGRAVSMSIGYAGGYGHALVVPVNIWVETVLVLLFYPLFVFSMRRLVVFPSLKRFLERTRATAEHHHDKVRRYGIVGLFIFVWFPFWMTGPVVGSAIGFLLGFPAWLTVSVVLGGTYVAMAGWAYLMFGLHSRAAILAPWAPSLIIGLIIFFVLAGYWRNRQGKGRHSQDAMNTQDETIEYEPDHITSTDSDKP
ncbi:MAG: small multi-drug export protein [Gammaproteobacteria bacterium]